MPIIDWTHIKPLPKQRLFFESTADRVCYGGARGGGKSWAMRFILSMLCISYSGLNVLLLRRTLPELKANHLMPLMKELSGIADYKEIDRTFTFPNGSTLKLGYCDAEKDVMVYQGHEYDVIGLEEATHFTENQMLILAACNRTTRRDFKPRMYFTCNPGGVGHKWVKRLFISKEYETEAEMAFTYDFIQAFVSDNPHMNDGYTNNLKMLPEHMRRAHLEGDWDALEGQYFEEFRKDKHVVAPFKIPEWWRKWRSLDFGYNDPCCVLWHTLSDDKRVYTYREMYVKQKTWGELVKEIKRHSPKSEKILYTVASPDMWQQRGAMSKAFSGMAGDSAAAYFQRNGIPIIQADTARVLGWQRIREYMQDLPDGKPQWQVFDNCRNLIRTLPELIYDPNNAEDVYAKCEDHAGEALRYGLLGPRGENKKPAGAMPKSVYNPLSEPPKARASSFFGL